jgi:lipopolysaccharide transport system permease protein
VEGFRWALLGAAEPPWTLVAASVAVSTALLVSGLYFFRRLERSFADLV